MTLRLKQRVANYNQVFLIRRI